MRARVIVNSLISKREQGNDMRKTTLSMPEELFEKMSEYLESRYGITRGRMAIFIQDAIREKLDRIKINEEKKV